MDLISWIDPKHLTEWAVAAMARQFADDPHHCLMVDDFLTRSRLEALSSLFSTEGEFAEGFYALGDAINKQHMPLNREQWLSLPTDRRSSVEAMYLGPRPDHLLGGGVLTNLKFQQMLDSPPFHDLIRRITGVDHGHLLFMPPRIFSYGHFVNPHSDAGMGKRLCMVLYLNEGWHPGFGGEFRQTSPSCEPIVVPPLCNRILLFQPAPERRHEVLPLTEAGRKWQRWAYSFWFGPVAEANGETSVAVAVAGGNRTIT